MVVAPLPRRRRGALSPRRRTPPRHRSAASVLSTTKKSATCAPSWKPNDAPTVPMADGADQPPRGRRATTRPVPNRAEKAKPAFVTRKKACARIEQRVLSRPRRPKRAVKDRAATSSSCYHEDGVEAMLDLCAAKGQAPRARQHVPPGARRRALEHLREDALGLRVIALVRRVDGPGPRERGPRVSTDAAPGPCRTPRPAETSHCRAQRARYLALLLERRH